LTVCTADPSTVLGYRFSEPGLLQEALTHRSAGAPHNERLEYLGDALLNAIVATEIFRRFPSATEGELSRLRANLVREDTLAEIARDIRLGEHLQLGPGELKSGGARRASILADTLEALVGAVYLDGGFVACEQVVLRLFHERLSDRRLTTALKDPKTRLQERLQSRRLPLPTYQLLEVQGQAHEQSFTVQCSVPGLEQCAVGAGSSRRKAEQEAAAKALALLGDD
jgi:ribonuclease III